MWYAISSEDKPLSLKKRLAARPSHLARLEELKNHGRLLVAGPHPAIDNENAGDYGFTGSLIIAEFDSLNSANIWAADDPYVKEGVYSKEDYKKYRDFRRSVAKQENLRIAITKKQ